jgi:hypothetical protein
MRSRSRSRSRSPRAKPATSSQIKIGARNGGPKSPHSPTGRRRSLERSRSPYQRDRSGSRAIDRGRMTKGYGYNDVPERSRQYIRGLDSSSARANTERSARPFVPEQTLRQECRDTRYWVARRGGPGVDRAHASRVHEQYSSSGGPREFRLFPSATAAESLRPPARLENYGRESIELNRRSSTTTTASSRGGPSTVRRAIYMPR